MGMQVVTTISGHRVGGLTITSVIRPFENRIWKLTYDMEERLKEIQRSIFGDIFRQNKSRTKF